MRYSSGPSISPIKTFGTSVASSLQTLPLTVLTTVVSPMVLGLNNGTGRVPRV